MRTNIVLIDFENTQPKDIRLLDGHAVKIKVFVGSHQAKVPLEWVRALQPFGANAEYIQIEGNGRNALDFHIAYFLGRLAIETPNAYFHVISKDTGFDTLLNYLQSKKMSCKRSVSIADMPLFNAACSGMLERKTRIGRRQS